MDAQSQHQTFSPHSAAAPIVVEATPAERAAFITRTYLHVFGAIALFTLFEAVWFATPVARFMFEVLSMGRLAWLAVLAAFIGVSHFAHKWAMSDTSRGTQYLGLGVYTLVQSVLFVPMIGMALILGAQGEPGILSKAAMITLTLFGSLTGIVFVTRRDFSFLRSVLAFGGFAALGLVAASLLFGFTLGMFFSYLMVAFACGYILYDTSNVMFRYRTSQHVAAALALFASVMLLFWYVLRILISRRR